MWRRAYLTFDDIWLELVLMSGSRYKARLFAAYLVVWAAVLVLVLTRKEWMP
jgi:hypothetical protein